LLEKFRDHDGSPWDAIQVEYTDPVSGGTPYPTMTFFGQLMRPGENTLPQQQNASQVFIPFHGSGYSIVGGQRLDWQQFDTIAVPGGEWYQHFNGSDSEDAILFVASDEPALKALGFYRRQGKTESGETVAL
jgi:gentisate 1,2-dioxygenase